MVRRIDYVGGSYPMGETDDGDYVEYDDYAALEARMTGIISGVQLELEGELKKRLALEARLSELEKDAARYRWIMDYDEFEEVIEALSFGSDDAIDRAMSREA